MDYYTDRVLESLWDALTDIPFDDPEATGADDLTLAQDWNGFVKGTPRDDIWHWFDSRHSLGVAWLLNERHKHKIPPATISRS